MKPVHVKEEAKEPKKKKPVDPEAEKARKLLAMVSSLGKRSGIDDLVNSDVEGNESTVNLYNRAKDNEESHVP